MGIVIRQSMKASMVSYAGALIGVITIFFIFPYFLRPDQIGLVRVITEAATIFAYFALLGTNNLFVKYYPEYSENKLGGFLFLVAVISLIGCILFSGVYLLFKDQIIGYYQEKSLLITGYFYYIIPLGLIMAVIFLLEVFSAQMMRIVFPKIIREIIIRIFTILAVLAFIYYSLSLSAFMSSFILMYLAAMIILIFYIIRISKVKMKFDKNIFNWEKTAPMYRYMAVLFIFSVCMAIATRADIFLITSKLSLKDTGVFSIAFFIAAFIEIPTRAVIQIVTPLVSKSLAENNIPQLEEYYKKVSINQLLISFVLFMIIWINIDALYHYMPNGQIYEKGKYVVLFIGLAKIVDAATSLNAIIMSYSKYYYYSISFVILLAFITVINNMTFIPIWGINGSAFATFLSILLYNLVMIGFVRIKYKIQPFSMKTIWAILISLASIGVIYILPSTGNYIVTSAYKTSIALIIFLVLVIKSNISEDLNSVFINILKVRSMEEMLFGG